MNPAVRLFPRWLHVWSIVVIAATASLLILGGLVTTFRAGMADPVWPTEPWFLATINWAEERPGFLIEHAHRAIGFLVGAFVSILILGLWWTHPYTAARWSAIAMIFGLLAAFGGLHGVMIAQVKAKSNHFEWPKPMVIASLATYGITLAIALGGIVAKTPGAGTRLVGTLALAGVMLQGLLGGVRVALNDWAGTDLATIHGTFAQVVFCLLLSLAVLTAKPRAASLVEPTSFGKLRWQTFALVIFCFLQIVWGAWIRHAPGPLGSRLHLIFAFIVLGLGTLLVKQVLLDPAAKSRLNRPTHLLMTLMTVQILLGVEAWIGKFLPRGIVEDEVLTKGKAITRSLHAHIGTWVLGLSVVLAIVCRRGLVSRGPNATEPLNLSGREVPEPMAIGQGA
jgi:heme a synthase